MAEKKSHIVVYEHQSLRLGQLVNGVEFNDIILSSLQKYYGEKGVPYYGLIHKGVKFNEFVGVIQVGDHLIEVLPKADKSTEHNDVYWRDMLIGMMRAVGSFDIKVTSQSSLKIKPNHILDVYIEMFIREVEYLLHNGLIKKYRKTEGNTTALKGNLLFSKHIQQNLTHQERFYVRHTTYDVEHPLHFIIYKALCLLKQINTNASLHSSIGALLLYFPQMPSINVTEATFNKLVYNRKSIIYKNAIEIARLLLLQYHPDVSKGSNNVLALMFDMNKLWEQFVYVSLRKHKADGTTINSQSSKYFWKPENGSRRTIRPDIVIESNGERIVLDTKWKQLDDYQISVEDLRQMYVYHKFYDAKRVALVYPGYKTQTIGNYITPQTQQVDDVECSLLPISIDKNIRDWQKKMSDTIIGWIY